MKFLRTKKIIKAGLPGTGKYLKIYGKELVCVRYRYDYKLKRKLKTIELIVDESNWQPAVNDVFANKLVKIKILINELDLRKQVKSENGVWNSKKKVWELPIKTVLQLNLEHRIVN